jgi:hypothetical protein
VSEINFHLLGDMRARERKEEKEGSVCHLPIIAINMFNKRIGTKIMNVMKTVFARFGYEISFS